MTLSRRLELELARMRMLRLLTEDDQQEQKLREERWQIVENLEWRA